MSWKNIIFFIFNLIMDLINKIKIRFRYFLLFVYLTFVFFLVVIIKFKNTCFCYIVLIFVNRCENIQFGINFLHIVVSKGWIVFNVFKIYYLFNFFCSLLIKWKSFKHNLTTLMLLKINNYFTFFFSFKLCFLILKSIMFRKQH